MKNNILDKVFESAKKCIRKCSTPYGLFASGGVGGYNAVWSRDSMIAMIGASLVYDKKFKDVFKQSIITLQEHQSKNGQIPNCVDNFSNRAPHVDFKTIDSTLWYIIGNYIFNERYKDTPLFNAEDSSVKNALNWLACQDSGEIKMLAQLPTSDWQDAFPHKYGHTISTQALYYKVLNLIGDNESAKKLKFMVNEDNDNNLWNGDFYLSYRWKNHGDYKEKGDWFDSLGNLLAIIFDLADKDKAEKILNYIQKKKIASPYPMKSIYPVIKPGSKYWQDYFLDCLAGKPNNYSNGGIWGYIGCFYVLALIKMNKLESAEKELKKIAEANLKWDFPEWIHPIKKSVSDTHKNQAWEAGAYILAYESLKKRKVLI